MAVNRIAIGAKNDPTIILDNDNIVRCDIKKAFDPVGVELQIGTIEIVVTTKGFAQGFCPKDYPDGMVSSDGNTVYCLEADAGALLNFKYGTEIRPTTDGSFLGLFYVKETKRTGKNQFTIYGQDYVGVLNDHRSYGFFARPYVDGISMADMIEAATNDNSIRGLIASVILRRIRSRIKYQSDAISSIRMQDGYLSGDTCRNVLQQVLIATNTCIIELDNEDLMVSFVPSSTANSINNAAIYSGGDVSYSDPVKTIKIVETTIVTPTSESEPEVIFDNTLTGSESDINIIAIDGPPVMAYLAESIVNNLFITNYTYVCFSGKGVIKARRYTESTREVIVSNDNVSLGESISFESKLITPQNSTLIAKKLSAYFFSDRKEINEDIVFNGETPGIKYEFKTPHDSVETGNLCEQSISISQKVKASCKFISGFAPYVDTPYTNSVVLTGSGVWNVPDGVDDFVVTLVGGGSGGSSGLRGPDGKSTRASTEGFQSNPNGADGIPGAGGKIYVATITEPAASYSYSCGAGGAGGAVCSDQKIRNEGAPGGDTIFGSISSALGARRDDGVTNLFTRNKYGAILPERYHGTYSFPRGSGCFYVADDGMAYHEPSTWDRYFKYVNRAKEEYIIQPPDLAEGKRYYFDNDTVSGYAYWAPGTAGGNANGGANNVVQGAPGQKNHWEVKNQTVRCGDGGNGATPTVPGIYPMDVSDLYGYGGGPGFGGGAGGNAGFMVSNNYTNLSLPGNPGIGGNGGAGGRGAPGCIIIYY